MYLGPALMYGLNITILMLMVIPFMLYINPTLTFYSLLPLPLLCISIYSVQNIINKKSEEIQKSLSDLSTYVQETFSGDHAPPSIIPYLSALPLAWCSNW